jgi:hypothetical protein
MIKFEFKRKIWINWIMPCRYRSPSPVAIGINRAVLP